MRREELLRLAENIRAELLPQYPEIADVRFSINGRLTRILGRARCGTKEVELSGPAYVRVSLNDHLAQNTIRHELAHVVAYARVRDDGHGLMWRAIARRMGCTGDRCTMGVMMGDEITVSCMCGWSVEISERKCRKWYNKGRAVVCPKCKSLMRFPWEWKEIMPQKRILIQKS